MVRSTLLAAGAAVLVLILFVLPAGYGFDVTGIGRVLGLTQRGQVNMAIAAEEAAAEVGGATASDESAVSTAPSGASSDTGDVTTLVLFPTEGREVKLVMRRGAVAEYSWSTDGGPVNFLTHGDTVGAPDGDYHTYGRGTGVAADSGTIEAVFDGNHGWFWRNRSSQTVVITLRTQGDYLEVKTPE
jgi:hypothetical protein